MTKSKDDGKPPVALPPGSFEHRTLMKAIDSAPVDGPERDEHLNKTFDKLNHTRTEDAAPERPVAAPVKSKRSVGRVKGPAKAAPVAVPPAPSSPTPTGSGEPS